MLQQLKITLGVLIIAVVVGGGIYWYTSTEEEVQVIEHPESTTEVVAESETQKETENDTPQEIVEEGIKKSFVLCIDSLYSYNRDQYNVWKTKLSELYPSLRVYDVGAYCELNNGNKLISFSHFPANGEISVAGQTIILFDENNNILKATQNFYCQTIGDLGYPVFKSLENDIVTMTCSSGDAGHFLKSTYELDLNTFEFRLINEDMSLPE